MPFTNVVSQQDPSDPVAVQAAESLSALVTSSAMAVLVAHWPTVVVVSHHRLACCFSPLPLFHSAETRE